MLHHDAHTNNRFLVLLAMIGLLFLGQQASYSAMQPGDLTKAKRESTTTAECIERFRNILYDEIANPSEQRNGTGGGGINHDYQMAQIITALRNLLMSPTPKGLSCPNSEDIARLKAMVEKEKNQEAREIFQIILGYSGETDLAGPLAQIAMGKAGPEVRGRAIDALWELSDVTVIPELIECLCDQDVSVLKDHASGCLKRDFPVRRVASFALQKLGVPVVE